jgi:hypothetical protein
LGTFFHARVNQPQYIFSLALGDEWSNLRCRIESRADHRIAGCVGHACDDAIELLLMHIQTGSGGTNLALVEKDGRAGTRHRHGRIAIVEHHNRAFPAQFQGNPLHGAGALLPDPDADLGGPG